MKKVRKTKTEKYKMWDKLKAMSKPEIDLDITIQKVKISSKYGIRKLAPNWHLKTNADGSYEIYSSGDDNAI